jgi:Zn finger protein HypA/HybF involved in hydrogenase expression
MDERTLAADMLSQLQAIAGRSGYTWITRVEMVVGSLHGAAAETLVESLEDVFEGTQFEGAIVEVTLVGPQEEIKAPGRDDMMTTSGWELLITRIEGRK